MSQFDPIAVFKIGDQDSKKPFLDGELIEVIDPDEQEEGFVLSARMQTIFYCRTIPRSELARYRGYYRDLDLPNKPKCILRPDRLTGEEQVILRDANAKKPVTVIDENLFDFGDDLPANPPAFDANAWTGGAVTVGSGGTYATWVALGADVGTFTSNGTATQIANLSSSSTALFTNDKSTYTMTFDGGDYDYDITGAVHHFQLEMEGAGAFTMRNFNINRNGSSTSAIFAAIQITTIVDSYTMNIYNIIYNANSNQGSGIRISNITPVINLYNCIFYDTDTTSSGLYIDPSKGNSSSVYEGNTAYNCYRGYNINGNVGSFYNCAALSCSDADFSNTVGLSNFSKCASSDATGSEAGLQSLTTADQFENLTDTDPDFLIPKTTGALYGAGVNPTIAGHTTYYNGVSIVTDDVDIGANGIVRVSDNDVNKNTRIKIGIGVGINT